MAIPMRLQGIDELCRTGRASALWHVSVASGRRLAERQLLNHKGKSMLGKVKFRRIVLVAVVVFTEYFRHLVRNLVGDDARLIDCCEPATIGKALGSDPKATTGSAILSTTEASSQPDRDACEGAPARS
jgi:hypothetical protein